MAMFKCKMCGGNLEVSNETVAVCEYCNTKQTLPKTNDDVMSNLFNRANNLRLKCEFDKAIQIYEKILEQDDSESEAHWGIVLCKYGIEYVEDPETSARIPTCHRTLFEAVTTDSDYLAAIDYSDATQQSVYESEARAIDRIQKDILKIVENEKPFDVFICYKETDENGKRTVDSTIANDIYYQLTEEGFKVFYSAITLEDKLGEAYEPYIFAALNSAKVMLVLGTKPEYFNAVWVKNEWSRYLQLMKTNRSKLLIPCYRDMDAYDLPEEFSHLQSQDMGKIGFINDVIRGIKKVIQKNETKPETVVKETVVQQIQGNTDTSPLLKRAFMFLEDGDFKSAEEYCEKVLDINPECAEAYLGKLMVELKLRKESDFELIKTGISGMDNYKKVMRFGDDALKTRLQEYNDRFLYNQGEKIFTTAESDKDYEKAIGYYQRNPDYKDSKQKIELCKEKALECRYVKACNKMNSSVTDEDFKNAKKLFLELSDYKDSEQKVKECEEKVLIYLHNCALNKMNSAITDNDFREAKKLFLELSDYKDSEQKAKECEEKAEILRKDGVYKKACEFMDSSDINELNNAINAFRSISGWKKSEELIKECRERIENIERIKEEEKRRIKQLQIERENRERKAKTIAYILAIIAVVIIAVIILITRVVIPSVKYNNALDLMQNGNYEEAISVFTEVKGYKDSIKHIETSKKNIKYEKAILLIKLEPSLALEMFEELGDFKDSKDKCKEAIYNQALSFMDAGQYEDAMQKFEEVGFDFKDSEDKYKESIYNQAIDYMNSEKYDEAMQNFEKLGLDYKDSQTKYDEAKIGVYNQAIEFIDDENYSQAMKMFEKLGFDYKDSQEKYDYAKELQKEKILNSMNKRTISAGNSTTAGIKSNGKVILSDDLPSVKNSDVSKWKNIISISLGSFYMTGLKSDGTVVAIGNNECGQCNVKSWKDITSVSANSDHTVGLKSDGTVVATGRGAWFDGVSGWRNIVAVSAGSFHTVGLKSDGTVVAVGENRHGQCDVSDWTDIIAISAGGSYTVGLKSDGTVVATGSNSYRQCNVSGWTDIVAVSAGAFHTVGLKSDGTVVAIGNNEDGRCNVSDWTDIVAVSAGGYHTVGLKSDGSVVALGADYCCDELSDWTDIKVY